MLLKKNSDFGGGKNNLSDSVLLSYHHLYLSFSLTLLPLDILIGYDEKHNYQSHDQNHHNQG
jgi:hypothetical protein